MAGCSTTRAWSWISALRNPDFICSQKVGETCWVQRVWRCLSPLSHIRARIEMGQLGWLHHLRPRCATPSSFCRNCNICMAQGKNTALFTLGFITTFSHINLLLLIEIQIKLIHPFPKGVMIVEENNEKNRILIPQTSGLSKKQFYW